VDFQRSTYQLFSKLKVLIILFSHYFPKLSSLRIGLILIGLGSQGRPGGPRKGSIRCIHYFIPRQKILKANKELRQPRKVKNPIR